MCSIDSIVFEIVVGFVWIRGKRSGGGWLQGRWLKWNPCWNESKFKPVTTYIVNIDKFGCIKKENCHFVQIELEKKKIFSFFGVFLFIVVQLSVRYLFDTFLNIFHFSKEKNLIRHSYLGVIDTDSLVFIKTSISAPVHWPFTVIPPPSLPQITITKKIK